MYSTSRACEALEQKPSRHGIEPRRREEKPASYAESVFPFVPVSGLQMKGSDDPVCHLTWLQSGIVYLQMIPESDLSFV